MAKIAEIDLRKYSPISSKIRSNIVILTEHQKRHIIERRGEDFYERYRPFFQEIVEDPDYILKDKMHENTAISCKTLSVNGEHVNLVIRLAVSDDEEGLENSIITAIFENDKRYAQRLRNNLPLYKRE